MGPPQREPLGERHLFDRHPDPDGRQFLLNDLRNVLIARVLDELEVKSLAPSRLREELLRLARIVRLRLDA